MSNIGMMDNAFFVGRTEIIEWINSTLEISIAKIEDTAFGAIACQLLDIMYPDQVAMHRVDWTAKQSYEFVANYKVLQNAFVKLGINKNVDVDRLTKGRYQDNLEFMQWFKRFFEMGVQDKGDYDCKGQRAKGKGGAQYTGGAKGAISKPSVMKAVPINKSVLRPGMRPTEQDNTKPAPDSRPTVSSTSALKPAPINDSIVKEIETYKAQAEESMREAADLKLEIEDLGKERDFYFNKLREVEVALQEVVDNGQGNEISDMIFKILYATAEGFEVVNQEDAQADDGETEY